jgi:ABC-2 type transport system ATP-binding protein
MKQRLIISAALLHRPRYSSLTSQWLDWIRRVRLVKTRSLRWLDGSMAVFLSTHTLAVAEEICTEITIIHKGKIIASDTPEKIKGSIVSSGGNLEEAFLTLTAGDELESLRSSLGIGGQHVTTIVYKVF